MRDQLNVLVVIKPNKIEYGFCKLNLFQTAIKIDK